MNFRTKLKILTFVTLIGLVVVTYITVSGLSDIENANETAYRRKAYIVDLLEIKASAVSTIMLDPSLTETKEVFSAAETNIQSRTEIINNTIKRAEILQEFQQLIKQWQDYDQHSQQIIQLATSDAASANAKVLPIYNHELKPFQARLEQFVIDRQKDAEIARKSAQERAHQIFWKIITLLVIVSIINIIVVVNLASSLHSGLNAIRAKLLALKSGDLTQRLPADKKDELSEIGSNVNEFIQVLQTIVQNVRNESKELASASAQLAETSKHVLASSNRQSDATSAVAATVEQFSVSIDQVSNNAADAEHLAAQYGTLSQQGGADVQTAVDEIRRIEQAVQNAVQKMQVLGEQAHEISSIVNVIKDVADQTNLLALNAAIEAARAGDSGRGFSVVADEVRNLAKRTAKSAQEITTMIASIQSHTETAAYVMEQGNERVMLGVKQAEQAGQSMQEINASSSQVMRAISDISLALREQRSASNDIAQNVEYISHMTEQNGAAVCQVSSAALQLEKLAAELKKSVEQFKT